MKKVLFILSVTLSLTSCFTTKISVTPISCEKFKDCKETIKRLYLSQKQNKTPQDIEVTDEYILLTKAEDIHHHVTGATTTHSMQNAIYFKDIDNLCVKHKGHTSKYVVVFFNRINRSYQIIIVFDKDLAVQGYSAIKCMIDKTKEKARLDDKI